MLHVVVRCVLAAVLLVAALAKVSRPGESRAALGALLSPLRHPAAFWALIVVELTLAAGVAAGLDAAALGAAALMLGGAVVLGRGLARGRAGEPCGCFGARSTVSRLSIARAVALAAAFAALPAVPHTDPSAEAWLAIGLGLALAAIAALGVGMFALAREVGMLRLALGPQGALEIPGEGPPIGSDSELAAHLDPRAERPDVLALAVFTSEGCSLCHALEPAIASLSRDPHVSVLDLDEVRDAEHWRRLSVPGSPYALALDRAGIVLAKGTFNSLAQLESVLAAGERRLAAGV